MDCSVPVRQQGAAPRLLRLSPEGWDPRKALGRPQLLRSTCSVALIQTVTCSRRPALQSRLGGLTVLKEQVWDPEPGSSLSLSRVPGGTGGSPAAQHLVWVFLQVLAVLKYSQDQEEGRFHSWLHEEKPQEGGSSTELAISFQGASSMSLGRLLILSEMAVRAVYTGVVFVCFWMSFSGKIKMLATPGWTYVFIWNCTAPWNLKVWKHDRRQPPLPLRPDGHCWAPRRPLISFLAECVLWFLATGCGNLHGWKLSKPGV